MADNTTLNPGVGGDVIVTEDIGTGAKMPVSKLRIGGTDRDGGDVAADNPLPVASTLERRAAEQGLIAAMNAQRASLVPRTGERVTLVDARGSFGERGPAR